MNTTTSSLMKAASTIVIFSAVFLFAASAYADIASLRDRGATGRTIDLTPEPLPQDPGPSPTPLPAPPPPSGGITSSTSGHVNTGGNEGGNVTTGDESVDVHEVNIGPTNPPPPPPPEETTPPEAEPEPEPQCDPRNRIGCATGGTGRVR